MLPCPTPLGDLPRPISGINLAKLKICAFMLILISTLAIFSGESLATPRLARICFVLLTFNLLYLHLAGQQQVGVVEEEFIVPTGFVFHEFSLFLPLPCVCVCEFCLVWQRQLLTVNYNIYKSLPTLFAQQQVNLFSRLRRLLLCLSLSFVFFCFFFLLLL